MLCNRMPGALARTIGLALNVKPALTAGATALQKCSAFGDRAKIAFSHALLGCWSFEARVRKGPP